ncbi:hypothetical protein GALL_244070 [mine drainage metagenome]|uniref:YncE family protein n=1 Tax=mine drainage metagenome TaxID=410659 RepID=A0A1J5RC31_9ZZZZ
MKFLFLKCNIISCFTTFFLLTFLGCNGQKEFGTDILHVEKIIQLPNVKGRIDHMAINLDEQIIYIAALGNNTVEAVDLKDGKIIKTIDGLDEPQGICYIPQQHEIVVANGGSGDCIFYNSRNFEKVAVIHLSSDADNVRYDSAERKIYVGYGNGGLAIINSQTHQQIGNIKLPAHPESFQIDKQLQQLFVNLPGANEIGVIDLKQIKLINEWKINSATANFPMALDTIRHLIIAGNRHPAAIIIFDAFTGKEISSNVIGGDVDDLYFDQEKALIFVSSGSGYINIFKQQNNTVYKQISNIKTNNGARTSLYVPELKFFILAARAANGKPANIVVYKILQ